MSLKKDSHNSSDRKYMKLAINLANNHKGLTGTNPSVGCVIVKNNKITSFGVTNINGRPHAEFNALKKNKNKNFGSIVYLTLEPCSHHGKTPPCTSALIKSKVKKIIYSIDDADLITRGKAKKILKSKNIKVKSGLLKGKVKNLYKNYNFIKENKLPYVIGKLACSANNFILRNKNLITNYHSRQISHLLRYKNQAILTSYKTINNDNPKLTCRINGLERFSPSRIVIDRDLKINIDSHIINNSIKIKTIIFHNSKNIKKINYFKKKRVKLIFFKVEKNKYFNLNKILKKIHDIGIHNLLVECGKKLTKEMILKNLFNEFYLFKSNNILNNKDKINVLDIKNNLNNKFKNKSFINTYLDKDTLMHYY